MLKVKIPEVVVEQQIEDIIKDSIVKYGDRYDKPEKLITVINGVNEYIYLNYGGMSAVFGKQKSRKTFYLTNIMSAAVGNTIIDDKVRGYAYDKKNLWFDTEQSKYYASRIPYRIVRKLNLDKHPENLEFLSIKKYNTEDRIRIINYYMETYDNLGLVIIDGIRDLVHDFNSLHECTDLINKLMYWVDTKNCHLCLVLHINPMKKGDDEKPRGHLGTEIQNKIESSILIEKYKHDKELSIIKPRDFRDKDIKTFGLRIDEKGIPYFVDVDEEMEDFN